MNAKSKERRLKKLVMGALALGVVGCWQIGWMPMAQAAHEIGQTINTINGNANYSEKTVSKTAGNVDGGVFGVFGVPNFNTVILTYPTSPFTITVNIIALP